MSIELTRRKFTVAEYHLMGEAGVFSPGDRVELIRGEIIQMAAIGKRHATCVRRLIYRLRDLPKKQALIDVQDPVELPPDSEPQPDVVLLQFREDYYETAHPRSSDVLLLVEVSDSTIEYDREVKTPLYAQSGIREVWIVNLAEDCIEIYRQPTANGYQFAQKAHRGEMVSPLEFPEFEIDVNFVLGTSSAQN